MARNAGLFLFRPLLQVSGKNKLKKGALQGTILRLGLALAFEGPSWTYSLGALPCPPSTLLRAASHHHIMALHLSLLVRQLVVLHFEAVRARGGSQAWNLQRPSSPSRTQRPQRATSQGTRVPPLSSILRAVEVTARHPESSYTNSKLLLIWRGDSSRPRGGGPGR